MLPDSSLCVGCSACLHVCRHNAISLRPDANGFYIATIDHKLCHGCGLCEKICPILHIPSPMYPSRILAVRAVDKDVRWGSSSGGYFTLLATSILRSGGVVFGAGFDSQDWRVVQKGISSIEELDGLRGSKYVQSDVGETFREVKTHLEAGRTVLYSGCPCQIAGLRAFLAKPYQNLLSVDLICHGVPSPLAWCQYVRQQQSAVGAAVRQIICRRFHEWRKYSITFLFSNGHSLTREMHKDPFLSAFLHEWTVRKGCYACAFRGFRSSADLTIGDFWGVEKVHPEWEDEYGISVVMAHTETGENHMLPIGVESLGELTVSDVCCANNRLPILENCVRSHFAGLFMFGVRSVGFHLTSRVFYYCGDFIHHLVWWIKRLVCNGEINEF